MCDQSGVHSCIEFFWTLFAYIPTHLQKKMCQFNIKSVLQLATIMKVLLFALYSSALCFRNFSRVQSQTSLTYLSICFVREELPHFLKKKRRSILRQDSEASRPLSVLTFPRNLGKVY